MRRQAIAIIIATLTACALARQARPQRSQRFAFRDVGEEVGLFPAVAGIRGHAAAWGDADDDGYPDLFVGTFHNAGSKPSLFLRNMRGRFTLDDQAHLRLSSCASGAAFADFDNDGDLDLYLSNNAHATTGERAAPSALFRNDGGARFTDVSRASGACPPGLQGRSACALDFDGDGRLELLVCDFYYGTRAKFGLALLRNRGGLRFDEVAGAAGLPVGSAKSGCAIGDLNNDTWPDLFLTDAQGRNSLWLNDRRGHFREAPGTRDVFAWTCPTEEDAPTGVCIADVNRDGLLDIVVGHHFKQPWQRPTPIRLYLNREVFAGAPRFEEVTEATGLVPLRMKAPHVEVQDFDNDGWSDILVSIVKFSEGRPAPIVFRNLGVRDGVPRFRDDAWGVNDWPTADDLAPRRTNEFFDRVLREKKVIYFAAAPTADFDRDGRLDLFAANWWIESRSLLLRNETPGGNWLQVAVAGAHGVNRQGIGANVRVRSSASRSLIGSREIQIGYGWCSGQEAVAHFGLGSEETVEVEVTLPHGKGRLTRARVKANQRLTLQGE